MLIPALILTAIAIVVVVILVRKASISPRDFTTKHRGETPPEEPPQE